MNKISLLSRRSILKKLGWSVVGISTFTTGCTGLNIIPPLPYRENPTADDASMWLSLRPEGVVEIVSPRSEMGQGISTAISQIVAEEIGMTMDQIVHINPRSDRLKSVKATVGSESLMVFGPLIASAAAALNTELNLRVRVVYGLKVDQFKIVAGKIVSDTGEIFELHPLLAPALLISPENVELAKSVSFSNDIPKEIVGKPVEACDVRSLVTASEAVFVDDITLPDMLYARLVTPPYLDAQLISISDEAINIIPGFVKLIVEPKLIAVVANSRSVLDGIMDKLDVKWAAKKVDQPAIEIAINIESALNRGDLEHVEVDGDIDPSDPFDVDFTLKMPMAAHAAMEPRTAIADFKDSKLEIWATTQDVTLTHKSITREFSLAQEEVVIHGMRVGGGFGGKVFSTIERDAAHISRKIGRPVKLQWTREDEFLRSYHRPPSEHRIRARLNKNGMIDSWWHAFTSGHVIFSSAFLPSWVQEVTSFIADKGVKRGAVPPYEISQKRIEFEDVRIPVKTGPWRGLGATPNCWAIETAIEGLARQHAIDPVEFRLRHLQKDQPRLYAVLKKVSELSNWTARQNRKNHAYGVACGIYKDMSYSATVSEIIQKEDGTFQVLSLWSVHDCGYVVNPDMVKAQIEGNLMWGIGTVFHESLTVQEDSLSVANFDEYKWASYKEAPIMKMELIGQDFPPSGAGETAIVSSVASLTNAIYVMTGEPVLSLPLQQQKG